MKKIIVVDDDATTRFMMSELLDAMGYECETVSSGMACIALLRMRPNEFSMVLMDIHMPGVTGLDTVSYIRTLEEDPPRSIPIVAITADSSFHARRTVQTHGMDDVLAKPVDMALLSQTLKTYLGTDA
ncbi:response regulator [Primorskyibacter sedentarius]|uniref:response regulator n=1 Tax=Primorskyibacter sedentarius TaxID=745311 RepID=UPI003EB6C376